MLAIADKLASPGKSWRADQRSAPPKSNPQQPRAFPGAPGTQNDAPHLLDLDPELGNVAGAAAGKLDDLRYVGLEHSAQIAEHTEER